MSDTITKEDIREMNEKLDRMMPIMEVLAGILIPRKMATERFDFDNSTLSKNEKIDKFAELGKQKTYIEVGEILVVKKRKKRKR